ncbi:serine/threonine-protein kinase ATR-like isoform X2 [Maniola jurtina]|uniref:serine/threonine-protein kinase ATR-like isoform X2 n=1 Tax=Maniola jurtina TaxID=191418 RepID=UPI001E68AFFB|nr:serine/threonine-protein kinase ATR-like isoform X2 [Maniola jurtina]
MEDHCDDDTFTLWQNFNASTLLVFNNLEHLADGLDKLLPSILKLTGDCSEVLVPRPGAAKCPDSYYCAFNTWLLGRLFYVCSVKELDRFHLTSKDFQVKILNILCTNGATFYKKLHSEYYMILLQLLQYYTDAQSNNSAHLVLENFTPEDVKMPNLNINLEPICVKVKDINTCKLLIDLILQLLSESIPLSLLLNNNKKGLEVKVFNQLLFAIENFSIDLKYCCLKFFLQLIQNMNEVSIVKFKILFSSVYSKMLSCIEALVQSMSVLYEKSEVNKILLSNLNKIFLELLKDIEYDLEMENRNVLIAICTTILNKNVNKIFDKELKLYCLSLSSKLDFPQNLINISDMDAFQIEKLSDCYCDQIVKYIKSNATKKVDLHENWHYKEIMTVIALVQAYENLKVDGFLINHHLARCYASLRILEKVDAETKKLVENKPVTLLNKSAILNIWTTLTQLIKDHKNMIISNECTKDLFMNTVLSTVNLCETMTNENKNMVQQILCFQNTPQFTEHNFACFNDDTRLQILKYLLIAKLYLNTKVNDTWDRSITFLYNSVVKNKGPNTIKEIIGLCPLLLINKVQSDSKMIGDILMPAFMTKEADIQKEVLKSLSAIACPSLGSYCVILDTAKKHMGKELFGSKTNKSIAICLCCTKCDNINESQLSTNYKTCVVQENVIPASKISTYDVVKQLFGKFLNMQLCKDIDDEYWDLVKVLCNHFYIFDYGVSPKIISDKHLKEVLQVFKPLIDDNHCEKYPEWITNQETVVNICINHLVQSTKISLQNNDYNQQTDTLCRIKDLGLCRNDKLLLPVTKLLVYFIMHPQCSLASKAIVYLRDICEFHEKTPNQVYHRYKKDYCKLFVECSLYNEKDFAIYLLKVVRAFGFVGYRDFISKDIHHFLPYLIPYSVVVKEVPSMIEEIAALVQCSVSEFLIERFPHIYVHVYLTESKETSKKCYDIIEKLTKSSILNLINKHFRVILTEFLLQYCVNPEGVLNACRYLARHDPDASTSHGSMSMSRRQIADFLNPKFLGVLAYFDHKLANAKVALSVKRKALKSFPDIMQLMGAKYLTPLRFKVLATLKSALPLAKEFPKILAEAWGAFIHNIDSISLGPLLSNLAVSLLQQFKYAPQEINKIFQYLILNNENLLSSHISDLFFLENSNISERVKTVIKKHVKRAQPESFQEKIKWYLQHLNHDICNIKAYAFLHMDSLLKSNRSEIHKAIFGGKNIEPFIVDLIDHLLIGCKDSDPQVCLASGSCFGQLGAIEPGHLPRQYVQPDRSPFAFSINDTCFAATALVELTRAFQYEKDTMNMDCYALTIQEILKINDISPTGSKKDVWNSFPENMHQIMYPLLSSRYTLAYPSQPKKNHPLFGSVYATSFLEWAHNWTGQLIPLIQSQNIRELLRTAHPSMRRDVRTLFLFLPYVLLHAIMSKTANMPFIQEEILAVIGLENLENETQPVVEKSKYKMLRHIRMTPNINSIQAEEGNQSKCSKTVYNLLDFLNRWLLEWCHVTQKPLENENYRSIKKFMEKFDKLAIARGNYSCGEFERALQYLELYMDEKKDSIQEQLPLLAEIYALLDEPDSVAGILTLKRSEPSLKELILTQVVTGRLQDAALCYERLAQEGQLDRNSLQGMIDCYLGLDQPFTAYRLLSEHDSEDMMELTAEPLWRLGRFEQLDELAKKPVPPSRENWGLLMGRVLLAYRNQDHDLFKISCDNAMNRLLSQMDGESRGESALRSGYQSILGLHIITEASHAEDILQRLKDLEDGNRQSRDIVNQLLSEWRQRLSVVQYDVRTVEPLLRIRRILLQQTQELLEPTHPVTANKLKTCIGDLWLQSAKHARKAGVYQQSYMYILNAEEYKPEELFIEKAKIYWARGQQEQSFTTLRRGLDEAYPQIENLTQEQRKICAKARLLIAKYNDETTNVDVDVNIGYYNESVEVFKQWEKSLVCLGSYYEKVSTTETANNTSTLWSRRLYALNSYGKALQYGHKYLYQSMPRMLSIWLDVEVTSADTSIHAVLAQMTEVIKNYSERLPIYLYLTAFSQIVSRICHPVKEVYLQLKAIIVKLILAYPQHTLWMMMCVIKSSYPQRMKRCADVFSDSRLKEPQMLKLVCDFTQLAEKLIELCNKPIVGSGSTTTVTSLVRTLPRLLAAENFSHIMMPFQEFCKIVLPSKAARQERIDFNIPTEPPVYIAGIEEQINIIPSLQKPRKVTLKGSDGKSYIIMLKPRDDLRKDYRLMEFNVVVNRFLQDAPETRRRRLYIRTYSVLPLNEECGLIEWVPNLVGLRPILVHIYKQKGIHTSNRELKEMMCSIRDPVEKKRRIYEEQLLPRHPPVFQEWFRRVFSDPYGWYQARSAYIRTTAVMSMVGYILGLGDRHGENILFDSTNGDTVHVDFNCLFNKGESFEWPERVPFRLTHNMEAAMGPLKHEGMFRKSCEAVMHALRAQTAALMSVIGPFVYDPLVSWGRGRSVPLDCGERTNEQALQHLSHIRQRLNGMVKTKNKQLSLSLSPEGQVEHLIVEATSIHNLCQMYIGWGPFL